MSLVSLIRFRDFDAQLTDNEFFNQFTKWIGRELITKILYNHFKNNPNQISDTVLQIFNLILLIKEKKINNQYYPLIVLMHYHQK